MVNTEPLSTDCVSSLSDAIKAIAVRASNDNSARTTNRTTRVFFMRVRESTQS
jgi:hypothetical protein